MTTTGPQRSFAAHVRDEPPCGAHSCAPGPLASYAMEFRARTHGRRCAHVHERSIAVHLQLALPRSTPRVPMAAVAFLSIVVFVFTAYANLNAHACARSNFRGRSIEARYIAYRFAIANSGRIFARRVYIHTSRSTARIYPRGSGSIDPNVRSDRARETLTYYVYVFSRAQVYWVVTCR